jgi:hypothetical protein
VNTLFERDDDDDDDDEDDEDADFGEDVITAT